MYDRGAFKREAKQAMRGSVPHFMLVALVFYLLTWGVSTAVSWLTSGDYGVAIFNGGVLRLFLNVLVWLFNIVMGVGLCCYALRLIRRQSTGWNSLFEPFNYAGRAMGVPLMVFLFMFLWALAATVIAGILVGSFAIVAALSPAGMVIGGILFVLIYIAMIVLFVWISLRYAMARFVLVENPDTGVMESIRRSIRMMKGYKGKFFVLELSFIGWILLAALITAIVSGIGFFVSGSYELLAAGDPFLLAGDVSSIDSMYAVLYAYMDLYNGILTRMAPWLLLAEVVALPLNMWLTVYQQTAYARFYNYVSGYDYHQYMSAQENRAESVPGPAPIQSGPESAPEPERPVPPPESYYTPAPDLSRPPEEAPAETPPQEPEAPAEEPGEDSAPPAEGPGEDPEPPAEEPETSDEDEI